MSLIVATAPRKEGLYAGVPEGVYHGDPHSISSSQLRDLGEMTPFEWKWRRDNKIRKVSEDMEFGTAVHAFVLEPDRVDELLIEVFAKTWNAKADQLTRIHARATGKVALLTERMQDARWAARNVLADPDVGHMFTAGQCELSAYSPDPVTGIMRRARPDCLYRLPDGRVIMLDLKKAATAAPHHFAKQVRTYRYHQQQAHYEDVLTDLDIDITIDLADVRFVVVSDAAPHLVTVHRIPADFVEHGRHLNRRALDLYAQCRESGDWPRHRGIHETPQPAWAFREDTYL